MLAPVTKPNQQFSRLADHATVARTAAALTANGMAAFIVLTGKQAKQKVLELLPPKAEVMNMTSMTLEGISVAHSILQSGKFTSVRQQLSAMPDSEAAAKRRLGAAPEWVVGSVHAVTEDGHVVIASNTGSQLPAYAYGAAHVVWVVGTHKIVPDFNTALQRVYEYSLSLESERAKQAYGVPGSAVNKMLVVNREVAPNRITIILVKEKLGF